MSVKLVSSSAGSNHPARRNANALRDLAARCAADMKGGREAFARAMLRFEHLAPIEMGYVATCMRRGGMSESGIMGLVN